MIHYKPEILIVHVAPEYVNEVREKLGQASRIVRHEDSPGAIRALQGAVYCCAVPAGEEEAYAQRFLAFAGVLSCEREQDVGIGPRS